LAGKNVVGAKVTVLSAHKIGSVSYQGKVVSKLRMRKTVLGLYHKTFTTVINFLPK
jgi:hypothetical protein